MVLHTNFGDVEVELWPKEAPKAVRNFAQLCMEGYYDNTIFHRIVKDFMVQGGDPSGTGSGGESIYGRPFKDEFHSRLKFNHRGLVACANENKPDSNGSQFFITLERSEHLDRKNTIFGRVAGDTIFNVLRIGDVEVDDSDRPLDPPRIVSVEVIMPPFDDIQPRTTPAEREGAARERREKERAAAIAERKKKDATPAAVDARGTLQPTRAHLGCCSLPLATFLLYAAALKVAVQPQSESPWPRPRRKRAPFAIHSRRCGAAGKALAKLSIGDEVEEDEDELEQARHALKFRSAHETTADEGSRLEAVAPGAHDAHVEEIRRRLAQEQQKKQAAEAEEEAKVDALRAIKERAHTAAAESSGRSFADAMLEKSRTQGAAARSVRTAAVIADLSATGGADAQLERERDGDARKRARADDDEDDDRDEEDDDGPARRRVDKLTISKAGKGAAAARRAATAVADAELLTSYQLSIAKFKQRKRAKGDREKDVLARLKQFTTLLKQRPSGALAGADIRPPQPAVAPSGGDADEAPPGGPEAPVGGGGDGGPTAARENGGQAGYAGKLNKDIDHRAYLPAAWRVDAYIDDNDDEGDDLANLRGHKFTWVADDKVADPTKRRDDVDDYTVIDPLLEAGKAKFNKAQHNAKKRANEWAGKANL